MPTNTAGTAAREYVTHQVHYLSKDFTFANQTAVSLGFVPAGATVIRCGVVVSTLFDAGTNDFVDIGTIADPDGLAADLNVATAGVKIDTTIATSDDVGPYAVDTEIIATYGPTGTAPTAGVGRAWVEYILNDDLTL